MKVRVRERTKASMNGHGTNSRLADFLPQAAPAPRVRVRRAYQDDGPSDSQVVTALAKLFTEADTTFFKPIRLRMGGKTLRSPYSQHAWVYAAVSAKATNISQVPLQVRRGDRFGETEDTVAVESGNPWVRLLNRPNPSMDGTMFKEAIDVFLELFGEAFAVAVKNDGSEFLRGEIPNELWLVHPRNMKEQVDEDTGQLVGWVFQPPGRRTGIPYSLDEVCHWRLFDPDNPFRGLPPLSAAMQGISTDFKAGVFDEALLDNSGSPGGVLTTDLDLHPDQIKEIRGEWNKRHVGSRKAGHVAILSGGMKYIENAFTAKDMQFLEKRKWTREEILAVFKVPKMEVGLIEDVNRNTAQVTQRMFWTNSLIPRMTLIEEGFNGHFLDPSNQASDVRSRAQNRNLFVVFDLSNVEALQDDFGEKLTHAKQLKALGYGLNDINARLGLGMPEVEWGEEPLHATGSVPISLLHEDPTLFNAVANTETEDQVTANIEAAASVAVMVRKMPRGQYRRKRYGQMMLKRFFEPNERRILTALRRAYTKIMRKIAAEAIRSTNARTARTKNEEEIGRLRSSDVDRILQSEKQWAAITEAELEAPMLRTINESLGQLGLELGGFDVVTPDASIFKRLHLRRLAAMVKVNKRVRRDIRSAIIKAITAEDGGINDVRGVLKEIRKRVKGIKEGRATTIARTETGILGNTTRHEAMIQEGVQKHEWINAGDDFVRPTNPKQQGDHRKVDGQIVEVGKPFKNGLIHPNDPNGPPHEIINCRCITAAVEDD